MEKSNSIVVERSTHYSKKLKDIYCGNCGKKGHVYKKCHYPVMSLGIICVKLDDININNLIQKAKGLVIKSIDIENDERLKIFEAYIDIF